MVIFKTPLQFRAKRKQGKGLLGVRLRTTAGRGGARTGQRCLQHLQMPAAPTRSACSSVSLWDTSAASLVTEREAAGEAATSWDLRASEPGWRSAGDSSAGWAGRPASVEGAGSPEGAGWARRSRARRGCIWVGLLIYNSAQLPGASAPLPSIKIIGTSLQRFVSREGSRSASFFPCLAPCSLPHFQAHPTAFQPLQPRSPLHRPVRFPLSSSESPRFLERTLRYH